MKPEVLLVGPMMPHHMEALDKAYVVYRYWEAQDKLGFLSQIGANVRAIATNGSQGAPAEMMAALPRLEVISVNGVGVDKVDLAQARARGIPIGVTLNVLTDDVADLAVGLLLDVSRRISYYDRFVREGRWAGGGELGLTRKASGKKVGILGLGRIGKAVAKRLAAFDMQISYTDLQADATLPYRFVPDLIQLASDNDYLVVTAAGGEGTRKLVGKAVLKALGPEGFLINVARGSVVDEEALVEALQNRTIAGAGLDVFADEPRPLGALLSMNNVVLQPHMASATIETRSAMGDLVLGNLEAHFAGRPLLTPYVY